VPELEPRRVAGDGVFEMSSSVPPAMVSAVARLVEICETQFGLELHRVGSPVRYSPDGLRCGAKISLIRPSGSWEVAVLGSLRGVTSFTREVLAYESDDEVAEAEILDVLGELTNMVAGVLKRGLGREASETQLGAPIILGEADCGTLVTAAIPAYAQTLGSERFEGELTFFWSERSGESLIQEIQACLGNFEGSKVAAGSVLSLLEELEESLTQTANDSTLAAIAGSQDLVLSLINGSGHGADVVLDALRRTLEDLHDVVRTGADRDVCDPRSLLPSGPTAARVVRDEETLELFQEFLQESEDGLDRVDALLIEVEANGAAPEDVNTLFRVFHTIKGTSGFLDLDEVTHVVHRTETLLDRVRSGHASLSGFVLDLVFESTEVVRAQLQLVRAALEAETTIAGFAAAQSLIDRLQLAIAGEVVHTERGRDASQSMTAAVAQRAPTKVKPTLKVEEDLVSRLERIVKDLAQTPDTRSIADLRPVVGELQDITLLIRMVPVAGAFQKMARMVRDLAKKTGKLIRLGVDGQDTKMGREALEKISDPLVHMIRNAVDHGIETPADREKTDKPAMGSIVLAASHEDDHVVITLTDDGKGLDTRRILEKAQSRGLVQPGTMLRESEIFALIFEPGFSTAAQVTAISGRGVGMDVVRRNVEAIGGKIEIASKVGRGTTFRLRVPFS